jgi:hypothetical protein
MLRTRESRREEPLGVRMPDPIRQLASRARRRVQGAGAAPDPDLARQREVVDAFFAAARDGNLEALVAVLDPEVVLRAGGGTARARRTFVIPGARFFPFVRPALINGTAGVVAAGGPCRPWASPSRTGRSSLSTCSTTPNAWPTSTGGPRRCP